MALPLYYNWRNLLVRRLSTTLTFCVVVVIVTVLCVLLSFAAGIRESLRSSGLSQNIIVLTPGATAESTSFIRPEEFGRLVQTPGIAENAAGEKLISRERCAQTSIPRKGPDPSPANVAVRGVDPTAFDVHTDVRIIEGRRFEAGQREVIVGRKAAERYQNLEVGGEVSIGRVADRRFRVVGIFEAGGGALESEIWAGRTAVDDAHNSHFISSAALRLVDTAAAGAAIDYINGPTVRLNAKLETDYYEDLSSKTREIVFLTSVLIAIMGAGAVFAVANTMYASVDSRRREVAMLRTLGFSGGSVIAAFLVESLIVCLAACLVGVVLSLWVNGSRQDFFSDTTYTVLAYELRITWETFAAAVAVSVGVGVIGALAPAVRAARTGIIEALRKV